jgi:hypothetical protein
MSAISPGRLVGRHVRVPGRDDIGRVIHQWGGKVAATAGDVWAVIVRFDHTRELGWYEVEDLELLD